MTKNTGKHAGKSRNSLQMSPELMGDLGRKAVELLVARIDGLPEENASEGDLQQVLEAQLMEDPPEDGR